MSRKRPKTGNGSVEAQGPRLRSMGIRSGDSFESIGSVAERVLAELRAKMVANDNAARAPHVRVHTPTHEGD